jgi:hypothetical protein
MERKFGFFGVYHGKEYEIDLGPQKGQIVLLSDDPSDLQNGFEEDAMSVYKKYVSSKCIDYAYHVVTLCEYQGEEFFISCVKGNRVLLLYWEDDRTIPESRGFQRIGRDEYEKWVNERDLSRVWYNIKTLWDYPLPPGMKEGRVYIK